MSFIIVIIDDRVEYMTIISSITVGILRQKRLLMLIDAIPYDAAAAAVVHYLSPSSFSSPFPRVYIGLNLNDLHMSKYTALKHARLHQSCSQTGALLLPLPTTNENHYLERDTGWRHQSYR